MTNYQSPLKILFQKDPCYSHLRVFGCLCYPLFPSPIINKLQSRSTPCVFLGYPSNHCGYKCYDLSQNKIILCRHVIFNEYEFPFSKLHTPNTTNYQFLDNELSPYIINHLITQQNSSTHDQSEPAQPPSSLRPQPDLAPPIKIPNSAQATSQLVQNLPSTSTPPNIPPPCISQPILSSNNKPVTRSQCGIFKPNQKYINLHTQVTKSPLPRNPMLALKDPNWKMTMDDEHNALIQNKT